MVSIIFIAVGIYMIVKSKKSMTVHEGTEETEEEEYENDQD